MSGRARPGYSPWYDVDSTPITVGCRVQQITEAKEHGALASRRDKCGVVTQLGAKQGRGFRIWVCFEGENQPVSIRPHLVRVVGS